VMFGSAAAAACMPAHDEALNDRSLMPPVSVTMQPRNLAPLAAALLDVPDELLVLVLLLVDEAELWLLPQAAMTSDADTASAAVAHALCFTLYLHWAGRTPAPDLAFVLGCPAGYAWLCCLGRGHASIWRARCRIGTRIW
jgi:hypothetical protein